MCMGNLMENLKTPRGRFRDVTVEGNSGMAVINMQTASSGNPMIHSTFLVTRRPTPATNARSFAGSSGVVR